MLFHPTGDIMKSLDESISTMDRKDMTTMKIGCCAYSKDRSADPAGTGSFPILKKLGYDYVELGLAGLTALSEEQFQRVLDALKESGLPCEACNGFIPASVRVTGPQADKDKIKAYLAKAFSRAKAVGAKVIVFGSSGAKNVPEGFPRDEAYRQIIETCKMAEPFAAETGITVAIEPLNYQEANIINTVAEGYQLAKDAAQPHVKLLVDYYHWVRNKETLEELDDCADILVHAHFAEEEKRSYPKEDKEIYRAFMERMKANGYEGRISMEAGVQADFETEAKAALAVLRSYT